MLKSVVKIRLIIACCLVVALRVNAVEWKGFADAQQRIKDIRMDGISVKVLDASGEPIEGAKVQVTLQSHQFNFGAAISARAFGEMRDSEAWVRYLEVFEDNFNSAVFENAMKWHGMNRHDGSIDHENRQAMWRGIEWLERKGIPLRGHNVLWPSWHWSPDYLETLERKPKELEAEILNRIDEAVGMFKGKLMEWDFVNEPAHHRDMINVLGEQAVIDWYERAAQIDPDTPMYVNQWSVLDNIYHVSFLEWVDLLTSSERASLDGIGLQGHSTVEMYTDPEFVETIWEKLEVYASYGLPIKITEFDVEGYKGEALQAEALENALTLFFSHPSVEGFFLWGFWDGRHWRNSPNHSFTGESEEAGFWRRDWSEKPAAKVWRNKVFEDWFTHEEGVTDESGKFHTRGFHGHYVITVEHSGVLSEREVALLRESGAIEVVVQQ